jgi:hypothetical protein
MWLGGDFEDLSPWGALTVPEALAAAFAGKTLTNTFTLAAGQSIDFSVDHNGARNCAECYPRNERYNLYDSTAFGATVSLQTVPEPGSTRLVAVALLSLGWVRLRTRRRAPDEHSQ